MHTRRSCCSGPWQHVSSSTTSLLRWRRCSGPAIRWPGSATAHCFGWDVDAKAPRRPEVSTCAATPFPSFCWFESQDCQGPQFFFGGVGFRSHHGGKARSLHVECTPSRSLSQVVRYLQALLRYSVHCKTRLPRCALAEKQKQHQGCGTRVAFRRRANETRLPLVFMTYRVASSSLCMWATHGTCEGSQSSVPSRENGAKTQKNTRARGFYGFYVHAQHSCIAGLGNTFHLPPNNMIATQGRRCFGPWPGNSASLTSSAGNDGACTVSPRSFYVRRNPVHFLRVRVPAVTSFFLAVWALIRLFHRGGEQAQGWRVEQASDPGEGDDACRNQNSICCADNTRCAARNPGCWRPLRLRVAFTCRKATH